ncbi:hypothetical protein ACH47B_28835 [Rhodococcus sp. NPDC019627]|uniref:hypothetical protein n=1 Tax=unclassified Rhodococcus (in: high G+C Gram-positive bacteria) TaxID=192944 RepID=UPI0033CB0921
MIEYSSRWLPYGGPPPEDIFVEFGLTPGQFAHRVFEALDGYPTLELPEGQKRELRENLASILDASCRPQGGAEETIDSQSMCVRRDRPGSVAGARKYASGRGTRSKILP